MLRRRLVFPMMAVLLLAALLVGCQPSTPPAPTSAPAAATKPPVAATTAPAAATTAPAVATTAPAAATKPPAAATTAPAAAAKPVRGGTLRNTVATEPDTFDPHVSAGGNLRSILPNIYDNLAAPDPKLQVTKDGLAVDWTAAADGMSILVKLRQGVKFHDGADFNADAAKFNLDRLKDPKLASPQAGYAAPITSVDVVDNYTIKLNLKSPSPPLMEGFAQQAGMMVSPAAVKKYGEDFGRNPVGTGPFQFVSWDRGGQVVLKRFDGYWRKDKDGGQLPYLDGVTFNIITDGTTAMAGLRAGTLDAFRGMTASDLNIVKQTPSLAFAQVQQGTLWGVYMNTQKPPFDKLALRQAIAYGMDREAVVKGVYGGTDAEVFDNYLMPLSWAYDPSYKYPYPGPDIAKAKAKLTEAGYPQGLKVEFLGANTRQETLICETVQQVLAKIGIEATLKLTTSSERLDLMNTHQYSMGWSGYANQPDPDSSLNNRFNTNAGTRNRSNYTNPKVDELLNKAGSIYDQAQRIPLYRQAGEIIFSDVAFIPFLLQNERTGLSNKVKNYVIFADGHARLAEVWMEK